MSFQGIHPHKTVPFPTTVATHALVLKLGLPNETPKPVLVVHVGTGGSLHKGRRK